MASYTKTIQFDDTYSMMLDSSTGVITVINGDTSETRELTIDPQIVWLLMLATSRNHIPDLFESLFAES